MAEVRRDLDDRDPERPRGDFHGRLEDLEDGGHQQRGHHEEELRVDQVADHVAHREAGRVENGRLVDEREIEEAPHEGVRHVVRGLALGGLKVERPEGARRDDNIGRVVLVAPLGGALDPHHPLVARNHHLPRDGCFAMFHVRDGSRWLWMCPRARLRLLTATGSVSVKIFGGGSPGRVALPVCRSSCACKSRGRPARPPRGCPPPGR